MANFGGHAIPGSFFLLFGFWLTVKHVLHHYWRTNQPKGRMLTPPFLKKMDYFEGGFAIFASFVGQFSLSIHLHTLNSLKPVFGSSQLLWHCPVPGIMVEQFVVSGPHARLYDRETSSWVKLMNWQHSTMYLFFGIYGIVLVASTASKLLPVGVDRLALSLALFVEGKVQAVILLPIANVSLWREPCFAWLSHHPGFLFYYHVHSRPPLDAHIHTLLLVAVFGGSASTMLEVFIRDNIILELFKGCMFILQGSWFYQVISQNQVSKM